MINTDWQLWRLAMSASSTRRRPRRFGLRSSGYRSIRPCERIQGLPQPRYASYTERYTMPTITYNGRSTKKYICESVKRGRGSLSFRSWFSMKKGDERNEKIINGNIWVATVIGKYIHAHAYWDFYDFTLKMSTIIVLSFYNTHAVFIWCRDFLYLFYPFAQYTVSMYPSLPRLLYNAYHPHGNLCWIRTYYMLLCVRKCSPSCIACILPMPSPDGFETGTSYVCIYKA